MFSHAEHKGIYVLS